MAESRFWSNLKTHCKAVTISDKSQMFYFKSLGDCAKFISDFTGVKASQIKKKLSQKAEFICGFKIFYETER